MAKKDTSLNRADFVRLPLAHNAAAYIDARTGEKSLKTEKEFFGGVLLEQLGEHDSVTEDGYTVTRVEGSTRSIDTKGLMDLTRELKLGEAVRAQLFEVSLSVLDALIKAGQIPAERIEALITKTPTKPSVRVTA